MATPIQNYLSEVSGKNYQGSTGYWGDRGSSQMPWQYRDGLGYPGDRGKAAIAAKYGVQAPATAPVKTGAGGVVGGMSGKDSVLSANNARSSSDLFQNAVVERNPEINAGINGLLAQWKANGDMMKGGFSELFKAAQNEVFPQMKRDMETGNRYGLDWLQGRLDSGNEQLRGFGEGLSGEYRTMNAATRAEQERLMAERRGELDRYGNFLDTDIRNLARGDVNNVMGKYRGSKSASGGFVAGGSSADQPLAETFYLRRMLPYYDKLHSERLNTIGADIGQQREFANADVNRYGFDWGMQSNLRGNEAQTAQLLYTLAQQVKQMAPQQAMAYLQTMGLPAQLAQQIMSGQISNLGAIGSLLPFGRYEGLEYKPGMDVEQPLYPVSRYPDAMPYGGDLPLMSAYPGASAMTPEGGAIEGPANRYGGTPMSAPTGGVRYTPLTMRDNTAKAEVDGRNLWNSRERYLRGPVPTQNRYGYDFMPEEGLLYS